MTIATETSKKRYLGNGATTEFAYDFPIIDSEHLTVTIADADDNETLLVEDTDYTVSGVGESSGGTVTLLDLTTHCGAVELPAGWSVTLNREPPLLQSLDLSTQGPWDAETVESTFDYMIMCIQFVKEQLDRAVKVSLTSGETGEVLNEEFADILTDAQAARDAAQVAESGAGVAKDLAEIARDGAQLAQAEAEAAELDAEAAAAAAIAARDSVVVSIYEAEATAAQEVIDVSSTISVLPTDKANVTIYIDGVALLTSGWTRTDSTTITLASPLTGGEKIEVRSALPASGGSVNIAVHEAAFDHDDIALNTAARHEHTNQETVLDLLDASGGKLVFDGAEVGGGYAPTATVATDTANTIGTTDLGKRYIHPSNAAAARTDTLPSVGATEGGKFVWVYNDSPHLVTINSSDDDTIGWPNLHVKSIEVQTGVALLLVYDHDRTKWRVHKWGPGQCRPAGSKLYLSPAGADIGGLHTGSYGYAPDRTRRNSIFVPNTDAYPAPNPADAKFNDAYLYFGGASGYMSVGDSTDWDIFGSTSGAKTVCGWVYCDDAAGVFQTLMQQYQDGNNRWGIYRSATGALQAAWVRASTVDVNINGGALAQNTWHHFALVINGAECGVYVDKVQVAYDAAFTGGTVAGSLFLGQYGANSDYFDGRMDDIAIVHSNIFGAAPNAGLTDTLKLDLTVPLDLVM